MAVLLSDDVVELRPVTSDDRLGGPVRHWAICERERGTIVGWVELRDVGEGEVDVSYAVFEAWRRRGIATRACRLALAYTAGAMERRNAVFRVRQGDTASLAVARKLGAAVTGMEVIGDGTISVVLRLPLGSTD